MTSDGSQGYTYPSGLFSPEIIQRSLREGSPPSPDDITELKGWLERIALGTSPQCGWGALECPGKVGRVPYSGLLYLLKYANWGDSIQSGKIVNTSEGRGWFDIAWGPPIKVGCNQTESGNKTLRFYKPGGFLGLGGREMTLNEFVGYLNSASSEFSIANPVVRGNIYHRSRGWTVRDGPVQTPDIIATDNMVGAQDIGGGKGSSIDRYGFIYQTTSVGYGVSFGRMRSEGYWGQYPFVGPRVVPTEEQIEKAWTGSSTNLSGSTTFEGVTSMISAGGEFTFYGHGLALTVLSGSLTFAQTDLKGLWRGWDQMDDGVKGVDMATANSTGCVKESDYLECRCGR